MILIQRRSILFLSFLLVFNGAFFFKIDDYICKELQIAFAHLQSSMRSVYDPTPIINRMALKKSVQQDAEEFYKVFIGYLEKILKKSPNSSVSNLISTQFEGKLRYTTQCKSCGRQSHSSSTFTELEIRMKGSCTLEEAIQDNYASEEILSGDNQYHCGSCNGKRDASRTISLLSLPQVLNFQVLRFNFDAMTGVKKKVKSTMYYPEHIDMTSFLPKKKGKSAVYHLSAVLLHIGATAYGGHYKAQIRDETKGIWIEFDDRKTKEIKNLTNTEERNEENEDKGAYYASRNAYMLSYALEGREVVKEPKIPQHIREIVDRENEAFLRQVSDYKKFEDQKQLDYERHVEKVHELWEKIHAEPELQAPCAWLPVDWLKKFISGEATANDPLPIENAPLVCRHNKLNPCELPRMKRISKIAWDWFCTIFEAGPLLNEEHYCRECTLDYFKST